MAARVASVVFGTGEPATVTVKPVVAVAVMVEPAATGLSRTGFWSRTRKVSAPLLPAPVMLAPLTRRNVVVTGLGLVVNATALPADAGSVPGIQTGSLPEVDKTVSIARRT